MTGTRDKGDKMKELVYKFQNPHNSCEEIHYHPETKRYYVLMPHTPYSKKLCTCTPSKGWYEADCPVRAGLTYVINGEQVTTEADGEIIDHAKKEKYENREATFYRIKPEYRHLPNYEIFSPYRIFPKPYDYMDPEHLDKLTLKRKDVYGFMGGWYINERH